MTILFSLLIGHALADFALQSGEMARGKSRHYRPENVPPGQVVMTIWPYWLTSHALIHAGIVWGLTERADLAVAELILHWAIDFAKCENWTGLHLDQGLHIACKVVYVALL